MRIAILSTFYPFRGGIAQYGNALFTALEQLGHNVKAFTFTRQYPNFLFPGSTQYVTDKDTTEQLQSEEVLDSINPITYYTTAKSIEKFAPDLVITQYWMSFFGPSLGTVAKLLKDKYKVISILHNVIPHESRVIDKPFTSYFLKQHHGFITMSASVDQDLKAFIPNASSLERPHPLYNHFGAIADKEASRKELGLQEDKKTLLFFGFIREYKGIDLLIQAFDELDDSYQLVIAGEVYGSFDVYQQLIDQNKNKDRIHCFNQYISDQEVSTYFSAADVCVLPYKSATQSGVTAVALHFELPIIATDVGGLKELVIPGKTGEIIYKAESKLIAKTIIEYFDKDTSEYSSNIKALKQEMSWDNFAKKLVNFSNTLPTPEVL
ncbi:glycosyltransferase [Flammeovirga yaeyamensis]|uniref:Glycosyltransferase n=1 Tax=Flammeovirga yaeyamensis TaxID=367791 RepID=A0AAX1N0V2_9BACT|nr:glycosyltransferase [Flammeovirga yaeyamensis]MBB3698646.1 glycosyltransferase involved in cell wall biosynthesis [Flammeovirga yaeyamensis]NMF34008.1 glycosyltransferase [Flammeovirga yaeyamensis]QWG00996.1 glycosyltransferase [Flammeovirga yaeyamensis]